MCFHFPRGRPTIDIIIGVVVPPCPGFPPSTFRPTSGKPADFAIEFISSSGTRCNSPAESNRLKRLQLTHAHHSFPPCDPSFSFVPTLFPFRFFNHGGDLGESFEIVFNRKSRNLERRGKLENRISRNSLELDLKSITFTFLKSNRAKKIFERMFPRVFE